LNIVAYCDACVFPVIKLLNLNLNFFLDYKK